LFLYISNRSEHTFIVDGWIAICTTTNKRKRTFIGSQELKWRGRANLYNKRWSTLLKMHRGRTKFRKNHNRSVEKQTIKLLGLLRLN
jgi:hypothetical protein